MLHKYKIDIIIMLQKIFKQNDKIQHNNCSVTSGTKVTGVNHNKYLNQEKQKCK